MDGTLTLSINREGTHYIVKASSHCGKREGFFHLDPSLQSKVYHIQEAVTEQRLLDEEFVKELGTQLFEMLFSDMKDFFHECLKTADHLTVILTMDDPALHVLPWELCYDGENQLFLGADPTCSFVRRDHHTQQGSPIDYPLKILVIISSPMDVDETDYQPDPDEIVHLMNPLKSLEDKGMVTLDFLERASVKCIQDQLKKGYHIVHFIGHGFYDSKTDKGYLIIEDEERNAKQVKGSEIARLFKTKTPQLLILTACESAPLIPSLLLREIPAVLAMQYTVLVNTAHQIVERFYSSLVKGGTLVQALSDARVAVSLERGITDPGWFTPVLYVRSDNGLTVNTASFAVPPAKQEVHRFDIVTDLIGVETFVGRRKDLWLVEKALLEENLKAALITGIGGIGKTALVSKFVKRHKNKFKAVFVKKVVDDTGAEEILQVLDQGLVHNGDERLHAVIGEIDMGIKLEVLNQCLKNGYLIVLDNIEVLIEDGKVNEGVERVLQSILAGDHSSKLVMTSRYGFWFRDGKRSGLVREVDVTDLRLQAAVQLLEKLGINDNAGERIYRQIGGNPQFLEFFAQLAKTRSVEGLLNDVTPVREKIGDWLLKELVGVLREEEMHVLKRICVFRLKVERGIFDVLGVSDALVDSLVYYSLVKVDNGYFMHQGVKDYVYSLLDDEKVRVHAEAAQYYEMVIEKGGVEDIFEYHYHLVASEQYEKAGALVIELFEPFLRWGYWWKLMELLLQTVKTTESEIKGMGLHNLGIVVQFLGEYEEAEKLYRESLDIKKNLGDQHGIARSLGQLGIIHELRGEYEEAEKLYRESLDIKKNLGDQHGIASSLHQLGIIHELRGEYEKAEKLYRESLDIRKNLGDQHGIAASLHQLGIIHQLRGEYEEAEKLYRESLDIAKNLGDQHGIAQSLGQLGTIHEEKETYKEAVEHYIMALSIFSELGSPDAEIAIKNLKRVRKTIGDVEFNTYWKALTNQEVPDYIYPTYEEELEDFVQYVLYIVDMNEHDEIEQTTETLTELLKDSEPDEKQSLQLLLDYIARKDISQKIKKLKEPFKSILEKYL